MAPTIYRIDQHAGIAGQFSVSAVVKYPDDEARTVAFVGSVYGGPVVFVASTGAQVFVSEPDRFGPFGKEWVRRFFADAE